MLKIESIGKNILSTSFIIMLYKWFTNTNVIHLEILFLHQIHLMNKIQMVDLKGQYNNIKSEVDKAVIDVIESG